MDNLISSIKSQKLIVKVAFLIILVVVLIFVISLVVFYANKYNPEKNPGGAYESPKTMEKIIDSLTAPVSGEKQNTPVSDAVLDLLTAPVNNNSAAGSKTDKSPAPTPTPVSKEIIDSLTAPVK